MIDNPNQWQKLGRILAPDLNNPWLVTHTGASFALPLDDGSLFDIYVTGRDERNRSHIGKIRIDLEDPTVLLHVDSEPIFSPGEFGAFDENGVGYPSIVEHEDQLYMYYVGWMPTVLAGFFNNTGLARAQKGTDHFRRVSRAPILPRTDHEPFGTGSAFAMKEHDRWRLWYTVWLRWGSKPNEHRHYYIIRHAESEDGIRWQRNRHICINYENDGEYAIGKPSVLKLGDTYHMWYVYRGRQYRIGYAHSDDGIHWTRRDDLAEIDVASGSGWESQSICYPHVFQYADALYMLYCGNEYGKGGLGLARLPLNIAGTRAEAPAVAVNGRPGR